MLFTKFYILFHIVSPTFAAIFQYMDPLKVVSIVNRINELYFFDRYCTLAIQDYSGYNVSFTDNLLVKDICRANAV